MKVLLVEPPKEVWFLMGSYLPPPYGIIQIGAYLERELPEIDVEVLDCNAKKISWDDLSRQIKALSPDIVASSSLATCNTYITAKTLQIAKKAKPDVFTVTGGIYFSSAAKESLTKYKEIDAIIRGEGEVTFTELVKARMDGTSLTSIDGLAYREGETIHVNPDRRLIEDLNTLPYPGYHLVRNTIQDYHFMAMTGKKTPFAFVEGSRGCSHKCTFCTQWRHWCGKWRAKTPSRIADEMEFIYKEFGSKFIWLTDDNFGAGDRGTELAEELLKRDIDKDFLWFTQMRCDDIIAIKDSLPKMKKAGFQWVLVGVESPNIGTLNAYRKEIEPGQSFEAVNILKQNNIFSQVMIVIGERKDTHESLAGIRRFVSELDPDFVIFSVLTPFPGTEVYEEAKSKGWIEDDKLSNYDMAHAVMGTETMTKQELQEELYKCYRSFYGDWERRLKGMFSQNELRRRVYWHMARHDILTQLRNLF